MVRRTRPGISRFRARSASLRFAPRNDYSCKTRSCGHSCPNSRSSRFVSSRFLLLAVADAIDRASPIVGNQNRAVLGQDDIVGPAEITLVAFEPTGCEYFLLGVLAVWADDDAHDARALVFMPVPGTVFGDQNVVLVVGGKLIAGVELHAEWCDVGAEIEHRWGEFRTFVTHRKFGIRSVALVAIGIAEMLADLRDHVELVARHVVADPVARVFGEPVFAGARIDVAAHAVADAKRHQFGIAGIGIDAADL